MPELPTPRDFAVSIKRCWELMPPRDRSAARLLATLGLTLTCLLSVNTCVLRPLKQARLGGAVKMNLHQIQLGLERFAVDRDDSSYPYSTAELITTGYLSEMPLNPYTNQPMREQPYDISALPPGDFVYLKRDLNSQGRPTSYTLLIGQEVLEHVRQLDHER